MKRIWGGVLAVGMVLALLGCHVPQKVTVSGVIEEVTAADTVPEADKTVLAALLKQADNISEKDYTTASYTAFQEAFFSACAVMKEADTTQPAVQQAVADLTLGLDGLTVATKGVYRIYCRLLMQSNDRVGNEWQNTFACGGQVIESGAEITAPLHAGITVYATVTEEDRYPDTGTGCVHLTDENGLTQTADITVQENGGCYDGRMAVWRFMCSAELVRQI